MAHARTTIRQAIVTLLTGATAAGNNVFDSRVYPVDANSLPGIIVYSNNEATDTDTISPPRSQTRVVSISVEVYAKVTSNVETVVDDLAVEIEQLIGADSTIGGVCKDTVLESTEISLTGEGEKPLAVLTLTFEILYRVKENSPQTII